MENIEYNTWTERIKYFFIFLCYGISVNIFTGIIRYLPFHKKCYCKKVNLIRHGKTKAVEQKEFMSDTSNNTQLSDDGILEVSRTAQQVKNSMPDAILVGPLERTKSTFDIIKSYIGDNIQTEECSYMRGINNSLWAGKTFETLDEDNLVVFLMRECRHDIFIKTKNGDSWGDVIFRCTKLFHHLNYSYRNKEVLLISQGSIFQGMNILLHSYRSPWQSYSAEKMFSLTGKETDVGYGRMQILQ